MTANDSIKPEAVHELVIRRTLAAPRAAVWRCWTEPELLKQWYCPKPWSVPEADFDLKPGGRFNTVFAGPNGERAANTGVWLEIEPQERLAFTDAFTEGFIPRAESFLTGYVWLSDAPDGTTDFVWGARHTTADQVQNHRDMGFEAGWNAAADQLEALAQTL